MSVYLDVATGKWFDTLPELKAFQRGEGKPSPLNFDTQVREEVVKEEVKQEQEGKVDVENEAQEEAVFEQAEAPGEIKIKLSRKEMEDKLLEWGVDGRSVKRRSDERLAQLYWEWVNR